MPAQHGGTVGRITLAARLDCCGTVISQHITARKNSKAEEFTDHAVFFVVSAGKIPVLGIGQAVGQLIHHIGVEHGIAIRRRDVILVHLLLGLFQFGLEKLFTHTGRTGHVGCDGFARRADNTGRTARSPVADRHYADRFIQRHVRVRHNAHTFVVARFDSFGVGDVHRIGCVFVQRISNVRVGTLFHGRRQRRTVLYHIGGCAGLRDVHYFPG